MGRRWSTDRLEAFSDGVFAIAITLLVLEIAVPKSDFDDLWRGIADQWPSYLAYVTSFVTIGGFWLGHVAIVLLAILAPKVAVVGYLIVAIASVMRQPGDRHSPARAR